MSERSRATALTRLGRPDTGWANTPIVKGSTYLYDNLEHWRSTRIKREHERQLSYGARGNETVYALEDAVAALERGHRAKLFPTGLAAISITLLAYLKSGDHVLISDSAYEPVKKFCTTQLAHYGITFGYFSAVDDDWASCLQTNTRMIYVESPGSLLYDMLDLPAMAAVCRQRNILLCADNTWGSCLNYQPLNLGADISIVAATKYLGGHSDVMMGAVTTTQAAFQAIETASVNFGQTVSAEDAFLVLRGMRTLELRLQRHAQSALNLAGWLACQPAVRAVFHPALPGDRNHALWQRDCQGSNGLLSLELRPGLSIDAIEKAVDQMEIFGIGASWGGYESLVLPIDARKTRLDHADAGYLLRLHIGLEDAEDLKADLGKMLVSVQ
ncbi:cystathionine beta-lyase [Paralcaligenes sp. KSB-10]|uniref:cystathionine beta-lyase n=1 Tax=Paralcaligenes sp. KSB-10 TaxID=2901142 RepID=UPI001E5A15FA|nr:cystathionine beta-lyase [Paralcaligenes sp. KSB-10]UHL64021.1 cystathionine beta-lyase [Paralcaligenes sp. KSB-10]